MPHSPLSLNPEALLKLPSLDKEQFIQSYLRDQRTSSKVVRQSRSRSTSAVGVPIVHGFDTPVQLQARAPRAHKRPGALEEPAGNHTGDMGATPPRLQKRSAKPKMEQRSSSEVDEKTLRLKERRESKKQRREIMKPPVQNVKTTKKRDVSDHPRARKRSSGLALMRGFTSTNVGASRLTINTLVSNIGVFNKGKASSMAKLSGNRDSMHFSEDKFLKDTRPSHSKVSTPAAGNQGHDKENQLPLALRSLARLNKATKSKTKNRSNQPAALRSSSDDDGSCTTAESQSAVWDIENDVTQSEIQSTVVKTRIAAKGKTQEHAKTRQESKTRSDIQGNSQASNHGTSEVDEQSARRDTGLREDFGLSKSSPLLAPSESASQARQGAPEATGRIATTSKYFPNLDRVPVHCTYGSENLLPGLDSPTKPHSRPFSLSKEDNYEYNNEGASQLEDLQSRPIPLNSESCIFRGDELTIDNNAGVRQGSPVPVAYSWDLELHEPIIEEASSFLAGAFHQSIGYDCDIMEPEDFLLDDVPFGYDVHGNPSNPDALQDEQEWEEVQDQGEWCPYPPCAVDRAINMSMSGSPISECRSAVDQSQVSMSCAFSQGRALLMGSGVGADLNGCPSNWDGRREEPHNLVCVERDVGRRLSHHWLPQKW